MSVYINRMTNEVTALDGELPLNQQQIEKLVQLVIAQLEKEKREESRRNEATKIRSQAAPDMQSS